MCDSFVDQPKAAPSTQGCDQQALSPCSPRANKLTEPSKLPILLDAYSIDKERSAVASTLITMPRPGRMFSGTQYDKAAL